MATPRVLIVDDEPAVLKLTSRILAKSGYEVIPASNGKEALEIVTAGEAVDVVLSDVVMPGIQGPALVATIRELSPTTGVVLMSAYTPSPTELPDRALFLHKPFQANDLVAVVEQSLAARLDAGKDQATP